MNFKVTNATVVYPQVGDIAVTGNLMVIAQPPDYLLASTGFGMRSWVAAARSWGTAEALVAALGRARVANRGAKAASANGALGLDGWYRAPNERFEELIERVLAEPLAGCRMVLQLHGVAEAEAVDSLRGAGAEVIEIDAYRLSLPPHPAPARALALAGSLRALEATTKPTVSTSSKVAPKIAACQSRSDPSRSTGTSCRPQGPVVDPGAWTGVLAPLPQTVCAGSDQLFSPKLLCGKQGESLPERRREIDGSGP